MIGTLVVLVVAVYVGSCLLAGYGPPPPLARFTADSEPLVRRFADPAATVAAAYRRAAGTAPGMRVAEAGGGVLLIDSRPTPRVLGGAFGLAMRLRFADGGGG